MAKVWVLDTETKGTGAEMVPLDKVLERKRPASNRRERGSRPRRRTSEEAERTTDRTGTSGRTDPDRPRAPRRYRIVSALTGRAIADDVGLAEAVEHAQRGRSVADVRVYVWAPDAGEWRALSLDEQRLLRTAEIR